MTALRTATITLSLVLLAAASALAGPPLITDDANTVDAGRIEIELNGSSTYDNETTSGVTTKNNTTAVEMKITTGLSTDLGISLAIPYTISGRTRENDQLTAESGGFGDMTIELKYACAELARINIAVKSSIIMPTGDYSNDLSERRWQFGGTLIATKEFADGKYALHANFGYGREFYRNDEIRAANRSNLWSGSIAGEADVGKGVFLTADFGLSSAPDKSTHDPTAYALTGVRYHVNGNIALHSGVKLGLTRPDDDVTVLYGLVLSL